MPSLRVNRASDEIARDLLARVSRFLLLTVGGIIMLAGLILAPLPGQIVLRNSFAAKRQFVRIQRAHPKMVFPIRRLMRREPEIILVFWQQYLRVERLVLPKRARFAVKTRRGLKRRIRAGRLF
jgi:hypothetical protein